MKHRKEASIELKDYLNTWGDLLFHKRGYNPRNKQRNRLALTLFGEGYKQAMRDALGFIRRKEELEAKANGKRQIPKV